MAKTDLPSDIAKLSFEDALAELEDIVGGLETGQAKLGTEPFESEPGEAGT